VPTLWAIESSALLQHLRDGADLANTAYGEFATYLREVYSPDAAEADALSDLFPGR
jgi:hypothetical protein